MICLAPLLCITMATPQAVERIALPDFHDGNIKDLQSLSGGEIVYLADDNGLHMTTDGGRSFLNLDQDFPGGNILSINALGKNLYAMTGGGDIFRYSRAAGQWQLEREKLPLSANAQNFAILPSGAFFFCNINDQIVPNNGLAENEAQILTILKAKSATIAAVSAAGQVSFVDAGGQLWLWNARNGLRLLPARNQTIVKIGFDDQERLNAAYSADGLYQFDTANDKWQIVLPAADIRSFTNAPSEGPGSLIVSLADGRIHLLTSPKPAVAVDLWQQTPLNDVAVNALFVANSGEVFAATASKGIYRSVDNGISWQKSDTGMNNLAVFDLVEDTGGSLYAATNGDGVFRSIDGGANWSPVNSGLNNPAVLSLAVNPLDNSLIAGTVGGGIFQLINGGTSWQHSVNGLPLNSTIYDLFAHNNMLYAATGGQGLFFSADGGASWTLSGLDSVEIRAMETNASQQLLAGAWFDGVFRLDGGGQWNAAGLENIHVMGFAVSAVGDVFAATHGRGVYRSANGGQVWETYNDSTISGGVWTLAIDNQGYLYAGTSGSGVYRSRTPLPTAIDNPDSERLPVAFSLEQNFPNPFNPATSIRYQLAQQSPVKLQVYDALGRQVRLLVDDVQAPGVYTVVFDAGDFNSGTYFYRLSINSLRETRRMLLVK